MASFSRRHICRLAAGLTWPISGPLSTYWRSMPPTPPKVAEGAS